jgi:hypothetical protein
MVRAAACLLLIFNFEPNKRDFTDGKTFVLIVDISISAISIIARAARGAGLYALARTEPAFRGFGPWGNDPSRSLGTAALRLTLARDSLK